MNLTNFFTFVDMLTDKISIERSYADSKEIMEIMQEIIGEEFQIKTAVPNIQVWQNKRYPQNVVEPQEQSYFYLDIEPEKLERLRMNISKIVINYKKYE